MPTNEELVSRFQVGDELALEELLRKNSGIVGKAIAKYGKYAEQECAEDLQQVGDMALWKAAQHFDPTKGFKFVTLAWKTVFNSVKQELDKHATIYTSTQCGERAELTDLKRKARRIVRMDQQEDEERKWELSTSDVTRETLLHREEAATLEWALSRLPQPRQTAMRMRLQGLRLQAIAEHLKVSGARIGQIVDTAQQAIRALVHARAYGKPSTYRLTADERAYISITKKHYTVNAIAGDLRRAYATIKHYARHRNTSNPPQCKAWTADAREFLVANRHKGWRYCAEQLGLSVVAVRSQARRMGIANPQLTAFDTMHQLLRKGLTTREIGEQLGVSDECIRYHLIRLKIPRPAYNARWRNSEKRREKCRQVAQQKRNLHALRAAELGWPGVNYSEAIILEALRRIGSGDRDAVAAACLELCRERGWVKKLRSGLSVLPYTTDLAKRGLVRVHGRGSERRVFSLAIAASQTA